MPLIKESNDVLRIHNPGLIGRAFALCFALVWVLIVASFFSTYGLNAVNRAPLALSLLTLSMAPVLLVVLVSITLVINRAASLAEVRTTIAGFTILKRELPLSQIKAVEIREHSARGFLFYQTLLLDAQYRQFALFGQFIRKKSAQRIAERLQEFVGPKSSVN
jgi:hypothetical protein